jgi:hypothetical protein
MPVTGIAFKTIIKKFLRAGVKHAENAGQNNLTTEVIA